MTRSPPEPVSHSWAAQHSSALATVASSRSWLARAIEARTMFQLASSDGSTGHRAFSISAGSASRLSPYSSSGLSLEAGCVVSVDPSVVVVSPAVVVVCWAAVVVVPPSPPHAAMTRASTASHPITLNRLIFLLRRDLSSGRRFSLPTRPARLQLRVFSRLPAPPPLAEHTLHDADDPVARDQHSGDDHRPEHHVLPGRGQTQHPHHLVEPGEEERGDRSGERAGEAAGEGGPSDDDGGDGAEQIGLARRHARGLELTREEDPGDGVQDGGDDVGRHLIEVDPETDDLGCNRVGAD